MGLGIWGRKRLMATQEEQLEIKRATKAKIKADIIKKEQERQKDIDEHGELPEFFTYEVGALNDPYQSPTPQQPYDPLAGNRVRSFIDTNRNKKSKTKGKSKGKGRTKSDSKARFSLSPKTLINSISTVLSTSSSNISDIKENNNNLNKSKKNNEKNYNNKSRDSTIHSLNRHVSNSNDSNCKANTTVQQLAYSVNQNGYRNDEIENGNKQNIDDKNYNNNIKNKNKNNNKSRHKSPNEWDPVPQQSHDITLTDVQVHGRHVHLNHIDSKATIIENEHEDDENEENNEIGMNTPPGLHGGSQSNNSGSDSIEVSLTDGQNSNHNENHNHNHNHKHNNSHNKNENENDNNSNDKMNDNNNSNNNSNNNRNHENENNENNQNNTLLTKPKMSKTNNSITNESNVSTEDHSSSNLSHENNSGEYSANTNITNITNITNTTNTTMNNKMDNVKMASIDSNVSIITNNERDERIVRFERIDDVPSQVAKMETVPSQSKSILDSKAPDKKNFKSATRREGKLQSLAGAAQLEDIPSDASRGDFGDYDERPNIGYSPIAQASTQGFGGSGVGSSISNILHGHSRTVADIQSGLDTFAEMHLTVSPASSVPAGMEPNDLQRLPSTHSDTTHKKSFGNFQNSGMPPRSQSVHAGFTSRGGMTGHSVVEMDIAQPPGMMPFDGGDSHATIELGSRNNSVPMDADGSAPPIQHTLSIHDLKGSHTNKLLAQARSIRQINQESDSIMKEKMQTLDHWKGYFNDGWNWLDFIIVIASILTLYNSIVNNGAASALTSLRTIRVLRPLRNVTHIGALRSVVYTFLRSLKNLASVAVLLFFLLTVFGILGVQLFKGKLHSRCFTEFYEEFVYFGNSTNLTNLTNLTISTDARNGDWVRRNVSASSINYEQLQDNHENFIWSNITEDMNYFFCNVEDPEKESICPAFYPQCLAIAPNPDKFCLLFFLVVCLFLFCFV